MSLGPWFKCYPGDFLQGMRALSPEESAFFVQIVMRATMQSSPITADDRTIGRWCNSNARKWRRVRTALIEKGKLVENADGSIMPNTKGLVRWPTRAEQEVGYTAVRAPLPPGVRLAVFERDGWRCTYCGSKSGPFHADHVKPVSRGGTDDLENLVCACAPCNLSKGNKTLSEWEGAR